MARRTTEKPTTRRTIREVSEDTLRLQAWLEKQPPDSEHTWEEIRHSSGVVMDIKGKATLRRAARRAKVAYATAWGEGIRIAGPASGGNIVLSRLNRVDGAVRTAERTYDCVSLHTQQMPTDERRQIEFVGACFGAMRVAAQMYRRQLTARKPVVVHPALPVMPE
jgi:hypothetical protein